MYNIYKDCLSSPTATAIIYGKLKNHSWVEAAEVPEHAWEDSTKRKRSSLTLDLTDHPGIAKICMQVFKRAIPDFGLDPDKSYMCSVKAQKYLPGDNMDWHRDVAVIPLPPGWTSWHRSRDNKSEKSRLGTTAKRTLTFSIPLNDDYAGGNFLLKDQDKVIKHKEVYSALVFPSTALHAVEEVTGGTRYTLNSWLYEKEEN